LPQEYWRKQTLLEIASGLGTPLIIDDTTLYRRLGIYARVLIDIGLSEQLFESVIVEREGHALSVMAQYERRPSFCTHCKMLGHEVHNCIKLSSLNTAEGTSKVLKAQTCPHQVKTLPKHTGKGKKPAVTDDNRSAAATVIKFVSKSTTFPFKQTDIDNRPAAATAVKSVSKSAAIPIQQPDMVDLDNSDLDGNAKEGHKGDEAAFATTLKTGKTSNLFMHNHVLFPVSFYAAWFYP